MSAVIGVDHTNPVHDRFCRCRTCKPPLRGHSAFVRKRPDGTPVFPLRNSDNPSRFEDVPAIREQRP